MAKEKFQLTSDLVKVESEPVQVNSSHTSSKAKKLNSEEMDKITINIERELKLQLRMYALKNRTNMTDIIHAALREKLESK